MKIENEVDLMKAMIKKTENTTTAAIRARLVPLCVSKYLLRVKMPARCELLDIKLR